MSRGATIALFGGSFNPPHIAHAMVCLTVLETQPVDRVLVVPTFDHAFDKELAPFDDRMAMCRLAMATFADRVEVSDVERDLGGESRTWRTLERLRVDRPDTSWRLVVGSDILAQTELWQRWDEVTAIAPPIVIARAGHDNAFAGGVVIPDVSSTEVRARLARGESAVPLVSRAVMDYIAGRGLYR
jgi:nicotinate-nucleotide adenylyltransferase